MSRGRGEEPGPARIELPVIGMTCANCATAVERTLTRKVDGVVAASVNIATETVTVEYDAARASLESMAGAVEGAGYRLVLPVDGSTDPAAGPDAGQAERDREARTQRRHLAVGLVFTIPLVALSMSRDLGILVRGGYRLLSLKLFDFYPQTSHIETLAELAT